jgi:hypothetical protein
MRTLAGLKSMLKSYSWRCLAARFARPSLAHSPPVGVDWVQVRSLFVTRAGALVDVVSADVHQHRRAAAHSSTAAATSGGRMRVQERQADTARRAVSWLCGTSNASSAGSTCQHTAANKQAG